jgi:hypothetical protein
MLKPFGVADFLKHCSPCFRNVFPFFLHPSDSEVFGIDILVFGCNVNEVPKNVLLQFMDAMFILYVPSEFRTSVPSIFRTATTGHWPLPPLSASPYSSVCKVSATPQTPPSIPSTKSLCRPRSHQLMNFTLLCPPLCHCKV